MIKNEEKSNRYFLYSLKWDIMYIFTILIYKTELRIVLSTFTKKNGKKSVLCIWKYHKNMNYLT